MPYYSRPGEDDVDELDQTPYGGRYDLVWTYGCPLEPCEETCYPSPTLSDGDFEYARPNFSSSSEHSAYADEALRTVYGIYARPTPRPAPAYGGGPGGYGAQHEPGYGRRSEYEQSESGYGRKPEVERPGPGSESESGYGRNPEFEQPPPPEFGSCYGRRAEHEQPPPPEFGSVYGRRPEYEQPPPPEFGPRYGWRPEYGENGSEYVRKPAYGESESEYGSGCAKKQSYGTEEYGGERTEFEWKPSFGRLEEEEEGYRKASYGRKNDDSDDEKRKSYGYGGEKGYGFKKYEDTSPVSLLLVKCVEETSKVLAKVRKVEIGGWFKLCLVLVLVFTSGPRGVRSEDSGDPLIPGSTAMNALLANKNLRGLNLSERRQMLGTETPTINYPDLPGGHSPPNNPARKQANRYNRGCNIGSRCRQGSQGKKN